MLRWLEADEIIFLLTLVQGRSNVTTLVTRKGNTYRSFNFNDREDIYAGPTSVTESEFHSEEVKLALASYEDVCSIRADGIAVVWLYEWAADIAISVIERIEFRKDGEVIATLSSSEADYSDSMILNAVGLR